MNLKPVSTERPKAKVSIQGVAGSGKSYSALLLAYGLCGAYEKVAVIETDYKAANHYSYFGAFNTICISPPYLTEKFIDAIELCEQSGIEVIIIDSLSQEWIGAGGMYERTFSEGQDMIHWHESLMNLIRRSNVHIIAVLQTEEVYQLTSNIQDLRQSLKPLQREDILQYFHTSLLLDTKHKAHTLKDRTSFFEEHNEVIITEALGAQYASWCDAEDESVPKELQEQINKCNSLNELLTLMFNSEVDNSATLQAFVRRRLQIDGLWQEPLKEHLNGSGEVYHHRA